METVSTKSSGVVKAASGVVLLAGIWLFVSPWVYNAYTLQNAWNSWIVGALMVVFAAIRLSGSLSMAGVSWVNCLLGIWTFASPWIYAYTNHESRFVNSMVVGVIVFLLAIASATSTATPDSGHEIHAR